MRDKKKNKKNKERKIEVLSKIKYKKILNKLGKKEGGEEIKTQTLNQISFLGM